MNIQGGYISSSYVIRELSKKYGETPEIKLSINNSITNSGHGSIFLGTSSDEDRNLRMLIGAHFAKSVPLKVGVFGGKCDRGEITIDTIIRETIEEIFNLKPTLYMIEQIRNFLNQNTQTYFIFQANQEHKSYSYVFDVNILGDFIRIINESGKDRNISYFIPTKIGLININEYYNPDIDSTIKLSNFLKNRYVSSDRLGDKSGLNEIKYLSFASLAKLVYSAQTNGLYEIFNFTNNKRETIPMQEFFRDLLTKDIILEILNYSNCHT